MNIIVNADDFGISEKVNEAIIDSVRSSRLTSMTTLPNGPEFQHAINIYEENISIFKKKNISIGAHLDAGEFKPLTDSSALDLLLDDNGNFNGDVLRKIRINSSIRKAVLNEWQEQIQVLFSKGIRVSHLDSHFHTHTIPGLFPVLVELLNYHKNLGVRLSLNLYPSHPGNLLLSKKFLFNNALKRIFRFKTTDFFTSFETFFRISKGMQEVPIQYKKNFELMIHPGVDYADARISEFQASENESFISNWPEKMPPDMKLISYHDSF